MATATGNGNDNLLSEGTISDQSGTSTAPNPLANGTGSATALRLTASPGDTFRLEILEDDFVGVQLQFITPDETRDLATDFTLIANPTSAGWHYSEALSNGGDPLARAIEAHTEHDTAALVDRAWRLGTGRHPSEEEAAEALALLAAVSPEKPENGLAQLCLAIFNLQEFAYVD